MPEGPSLVILKEEVKKFQGKKVISVGGNSKIDKNQFVDQKVLEFKTWGKHFLIRFKNKTIRIHFLLFGSYLIDENKEAKIRLQLKFKNGFLNFYASAVKVLDENLDEIYDWSADIMSPDWDATAAKKKLRENPKLLICDALLDQNIFSGSGNIIKNEVLYRVRIHPKSKCGKLPAVKLNQLTKEARNYAFDF